MGVVSNQILMQLSYSEKVAFLPKGVGLRKAGIGFFWNMGVGLAIGLFCLINWGLYAIGGALLVSTVSMLIKSDHYRNYIKNCEERNTKPGKMMYFILSFIMSSIVIWSIAIVVFGIRFSGR